MSCTIRIVSPGTVMYLSTLFQALPCSSSLNYIAPTLKQGMQPSRRMKYLSLQSWMHEGAYSPQVTGILSILGILMEGMEVLNLKARSGYFSIARVCKGPIIYMDVRTV